MSSRMIDRSFRAVHTVEFNAPRGKPRNRNTLNRDDRLRCVNRRMETRDEFPRISERAAAKLSTFVLSLLFSTVPARRGTPRRWLRRADKILIYTKVVGHRERVVTLDRREIHAPVYIYTVSARCSRSATFNPVAK